MAILIYKVKKEQRLTTDEKADMFLNYHIKTIILAYMCDQEIQRALPVITMMGS